MKNFIKILSFFLIFFSMMVIVGHIDRLLDIKFYGTEIQGEKK